MKPSLNDFDSDVRETANQLASADFSAQSQQRSTLRAQLMEQMSRQNTSPHIAFRPQRRSHLYAVMGTLAASLMLGMIVMIQSRGPAPLTEMIIPTTLDAEVTNIPIEELPRFYDSLSYAAAAVQKPLYAPSQIPEDYSLRFAALSSPAKSLTTFTSVYIKGDPWRESMLQGMTFYGLAAETEYLYIAQEIDNPYATSGIWNLPPNFAMSQSQITELFNSQPADSPAHYGYSNGGRVLLWRPEEGLVFLLVSSRLEDEELLEIAQSLQPISTNDVFSAPGSCDVPGPGETPTSDWVLPIQKDSYTFERGFYSGHTGIDLKADKDTPIYAANSGKVVFAGLSQWGYGKSIVISHGSMMTLYAHLNSIDVTCGEVVQSAQMIGTVGSTGNSSGPHLHFEMRQVDEGLVPINPDDMLDF